MPVKLIPLILLLPSFAAAVPPEPIQVAGLRCEDRVNPLNVQVARPVLSWRLQSMRRGLEQTAFRLVVASRERDLQDGRGVVWDSGKMPSVESAGLRYGGPPLVAGKTYYWRVAVWSSLTENPVWSAAAHWSMGLLTQADWTGEWIGAGKREDSASILLRREVELKRRVRRAVVHLSGIGYSELTINGERASDDVLSPGFTDYTRRVMYVTYDVTRLLRKGRNCLGVQLGGGWYQMPTPDLWGCETSPWTAPPRLLLDLDLEFEDGSKMRVASDRQWTWSTGEIRYNSVRGGETIDARLGQPGWDRTGFPARDWQPVSVLPAPAGRLVAQEHPPVRVVETIRPVALSEPKPGVYVFDIGVNIAGWVRLRASGSAGQKLVLKFNEALNSDGTVNAGRNGSHTRGRFQTGEFLLSGKGVDVFEPRFTYHGFRYVEVTGLENKPSLDSLVARWVHTDMEQTGEFSCSNAKFNKLHAAILRTHRNYIHHHPADPLREKMGWTQDAWNLQEMGYYNFNAAAVYRKWHRDMMDGQDPNGHVPPIVPTCGWGKTKADGSPGVYSDPWWGGAIVYVPWLHYQMTGDTTMLEEGLPAAKRFVDYLSSTAKDDVITWWLGDWGEVGTTGRPQRTPVEQTSTAAYSHLALLVSRSAEVLGQKGDAAKYRDLAERVRSGFNARYLNPSTGLYSNNSQSAQVLPLSLGMTPPEAEAQVLHRTLENIRESNDHHNTGFMGLKALLEVLTDRGHAELAYRIATKEDFPSWWEMIKDGWSTVSEYWDPNRGSRNIPTLSGPLDLWFYRALAGIRPDPAAPGFKRFVVRPEIVGDLSWVKAKHNSPYGMIESSWERSAETLKLTVRVPANSRATIWVPAAKPGDVMEGGQSWMKSEGLRFLRMDRGRAVFEAASGLYLFESRLSLTPAI